MKQTIFKSILAGLLIGIAGYSNVFCSVKGYPILGMFLFSLGLISIFILQQNLFTGKIGFAKPKGDSIVFLLVVLAFNCVGAFLVGVVARFVPELHGACKTLFLSKFDKPIWLEFVNAVFCGFIIHLSVLINRKCEGKHLLPIVLCIMLFIVSGFEHCIADMFYFMAGITTESGYIWKGILYILLFIVGNSVGSILLNLIYELGIEKRKE